MMKITTLHNNSEREKLLEFVLPIFKLATSHTHTHCSQQICWAFTHGVTGRQVVIFVWYVPVHAAVTGMRFLVNCSMVITHHLIPLTKHQLTFFYYLIEKCPPTKEISGLQVYQEECNCCIKCSSFTYLW